MSNQPSQTENQIQASNLVEVTRSFDFKTFYANNLRFKISPTEISLVFGMADEPSPGKNTIQESVNIILHPSTAKIIAKILSGAMELYEKYYGHIDPPSQVSIDQGELQKMVDSVVKQAN
jgi:hypothetical protein